MSAITSMMVVMVGALAALVGVSILVVYGFHHLHAVVGGDDVDEYGRKIWHIEGAEDVHNSSPEDGAEQEPYNPWGQF